MKTVKLIISLKDQNDPVAQDSLGLRLKTPLLCTKAYSQGKYRIYSLYLDGLLLPKIPSSYAVQLVLGFQRYFLSYNIFLF